MADDSSGRKLDWHLPQIDVGSFSLLVIVFIAVIGVRVVAVSNWNTDLMGGILSGLSFSDLPSLVISILLTSKHGAMYVLLGVAAYFYLGSISSPPKLQRATVALAIVIVVLALGRHLVVAGTYRGYWIAVIVVAGIILTGVGQFSGSDGFSIFLAFARGVAVVATFVCATSIATSRVPWVPRECIYVGSGSISGWVVGENANSQWLRVLTDTQPRKLDLVRIDDVRSRIVKPKGGCALIP